MEKNKIIINILLIVICILVIVACIVGYLYFTDENVVKQIESNNEEEFVFNIEDYPKVECLIDTLPLAEALKSKFTGADIEDIEPSRINNAYVNLIKEDTDLILAEYPSENVLKFAQKNGVELEITPIAKDGFVFFVNKNNKIDNLSLEQIQQIYSGKTRNWKNLQGIDSEILAYQKPENSKSQLGMLSLVMQGIKIIDPITETIAKNNIEIVNVVSDYNNKENAIGYSYYYYITTMYTKSEIKLLSINDIEPTYDNIKNGLYNLQTSYYAIIRKDEEEDSNTRKLLKEIISERGQNVVKEAGYVQNY